MGVQVMEPIGQPGFEICGKTGSTPGDKLGTAERMIQRGEEPAKPIAGSLVLLPAYRPQVVVTILVEFGNGRPDSCSYRLARCLNSTGKSMLDRRIFKEIDWTFILLMVVISVIGIIFVHSAIYFQASKYVWKQSAWLVVSLLLC